MKIGEKLSPEAAAAETEGDLWELFFTKEACIVIIQQALV